MKEKQLEENNKIIRKRIEQSNNYEWLIPLLKAKQNLTEKTIKKIYEIKSFEIHNLLKKNYYVEEVIGEE